MNILGIDANTHNIGWVLINTQPGVVLASGEIEVEGEDWVARCVNGARDVAVVAAGLSQSYLIDLIALEQPASKLNFQTLLALAFLDGCIAGVLLSKYLLSRYRVALVTAQQAKLALTGAGDAGKDDMMLYAARGFGLTGCSEHVADALGVALAGGAQERQRRVEALA